MKSGNRKSAGGKPLRTKLGLIAALTALVLLAVAPMAAGQPTPFAINGWVNCTDSTPVNDPNVTVTNLNTSEVFVGATNASSNYYQIVTSSLNVSAGNVLNFNVSNNEFDHPVTQGEMDAGGFEQNVTIECGPVGICGDVDGDGIITMGDVGLLWPHVFFPVEYPLVNEWAGDVDGDGIITMGDVGLLWPHVFFPTEYPLNCR
jgi:hypothetical protein